LFDLIWSEIASGFITTYNLQLFFSKNQIILVEAEIVKTIDSLFYGRNMGHTAYKLCS